MNIQKWLTENTVSLTGKTVAITGATGGIGQELCEYLALLGAKLILLDRNTEKSSALQEKLMKRHPDLSVDRIRLDLEDTSLVKTVSEKLCGLPIDILILNAGAYSKPRHKCETGLDNVFQINFLSPYYIARELLPLLRKRNGKIVAVGSIAHNYSRTDKEDIDFSSRKKSSLVYGNAKRYLMFSLYGLCGGKNLSIVHPGITFTNITAHYPKLVFALIKHPMKIIFMKPKKAALSIIKGIFDSCQKNEWIGPNIFNIWGLPKKQKLFTCTEAECAEICKNADILYRKMK